MPKDTEYLKDISKIKISFENKENLENLSFCYNLVNMTNPETNKLDKYLIFTSKLQMNLLKKCSQLLIDGTFKSCPRGYYQIINIAGYYEEINSIIPIFMIPTTGKSFYLYDSILNDVKKIMKDNQIESNSFPNRVLIDFEIKINFMSI